MDLDRLLDPWCPTLEDSHWLRNNRTLPSNVIYHPGCQPLAKQPKAIRPLTQIPRLNQRMHDWAPALPEVLEKAFQ